MPGAEALDAVDGRRCWFERLCYAAEAGEWTLLRGAGSQGLGVPMGAERTSPAVASLSSVVRHNLMHWTAVDADAGEALDAADGVMVVPGTTVLFNRFKPDNVHHVLHDDLLPLYYTLLETGLLDRPAALLALDIFDPTSGVEFEALYRLLGTGAGANRTLLHHRRDLAVGKGLVCFEKVVVGLSKRSVWCGLPRRPKTCMDSYGGTAGISTGSTGCRGRWRCRAPQRRGSGGGRCGALPTLWRRGWA